MIVYTKQGNRTDIFYLTAYSSGVWVTPFNNTKTYTDPYDSSVWTWDSMGDYTEEILGITLNGQNLFPVTSVDDCIDLIGSFYFDDTNGLLYVHYYENAYDRSVDRDISSLSYIVAGYASEYNHTSKNVFDGFYYKTKITALSGFSKKADPIRLGLIAFDASSYTITDQENEFYNQDSSEIVGVPLWAYIAEETATELTNDDRIFTAYQTGSSHSRESITYSLIETRLYENKPVCPNVLSIDDFPDAGDYEGQIIPVAYGLIRRGFMLLTNADTLTTAASGSAVFLVADPSLYEVNAITAVYDSDDIEISIVSSDLTACTVTVTKPADVAVSDLKKWTWQGQGYDITGTYNNGLDIIKANFLTIANIPYLSSTYDTAIWSQETADNTDPIGISIQSDKGFIEELVEPISVSLQGVIEILGDGRISAAFRDVDASVSITIDKRDQLDEPTIKEDSKNTVSELIVEYSKNFPAKEPLSYLYDDDKAITVDNYGINRREPLSPVKTCLATESGAENCANKIMATAKQPERIISVEKRGLETNLRLFQIVKIDTGIEENINYEYGELLAFTPNFFTNSMTLEIRVLPDYDEGLVGAEWFGTVFSDGTEDITSNFSDGSEDITENFQITEGDVT